MTTRMFQELRIYALYGPGTALSLRAKRSGAFVYSLQGNVQPLFPLPEMGLYSGTDEPGMAAIFREADLGLSGAASNPRPQPDSAFVSVKSDRGDDWSFDLYDIPAQARPFLDAVFAWVEGAGRASKVRTITVTAKFSATSAREFRPVGISLSLTNIAPQPVVVSSPRGETLENILADASPFASPERYEVFTGDDLRVTGIAPSGMTLRMDSGSQMDVFVEATRGLARGTYRGTLVYRSQRADVEPSRRLGLSGIMHIDLGDILITP